MKNLQLGRVIMKVPILTTDHLLPVEIHDSLVLHYIRMLTPAEDRQVLVFGLPACHPLNHPPQITVTYQTIQLKIAEIKEAYT